MKRHLIAAVGLMTLAALPALAAPVSFTECPAVGHDTTGCEILISVTGVDPMTEFATAFTVSTSSPDLGPFDGSDDTLIGVLNASPIPLFKVFFTVAPGTGTFAFDDDGACRGTGSPLASIYSPGPTAAQCNHGYNTIDAFDYISSNVTFCSFSLAAACVIVGNGQLAPGGTSWFSIPGAVTASEIAMVTPEPSMTIPLLTALLLIAFAVRGRAAPGKR